MYPPGDKPSFKTIELLFWCGKTRQKMDYDLTKLAQRLLYGYKIRTVFNFNLISNLN